MSQRTLGPLFHEAQEITETQTGLQKDIMGHFNSQNIDVTFHWHHHRRAALQHTNRTLQKWFFFSEFSHLKKYLYKRLWYFWTVCDPSPPRSEDPWTGFAPLTSTWAGRSCRRLPGDSRTSSQCVSLSSPHTAPQHHTAHSSTHTHSPRKHTNPHQSPALSTLIVDNDTVMGPCFVTHNITYYMNDITVTIITFNGTYYYLTLYKSNEWLFTMGTCPNFFSQGGILLVCSFSRTSWRAPSW